MRRFFCFSLFLIGFSACALFQSLDQRLVSADDRTREVALKKLADLPIEKQTRLVPPLVARLQDPESRVVNRAVQALVVIGQPAIDGIRVKIKEPDPYVRMSAISALGRIGPLAVNALPDLTAALQDPHPLVREEAAFAIGEMGPKAESAAPALLQAFKDGNNDLKLAVIDSLKKLGIRPPPNDRRANPRIS